MLKTASLVSKYNALEKIEEGQRCIASSINYGVARNRISRWNHDIAVRNAVETLINFSLFRLWPRKIRSSTVEISRLVERELSQADSVTDFL